MKKLILLSSTLLMLLCSCDKSSNIYSNYLNKEYYFAMWDASIHFYENSVSINDKYKRYPCFYEKDKLEDNVINTSSVYSDYLLKKGEEYTMVYFQNGDSNYKPYYELLGLFYNDNTFMRIIANDSKLYLYDVAFVM